MNVSFDQISISSLISISFTQIRTSTNTCTNEQSIFKLDVRLRVLVLPPKSTIRDIDANALCQEAYMYDYIWLNQMWAPGGYNYQVNSNGEAQQANIIEIYKVLKSTQSTLNLVSQLIYYTFSRTLRTSVPI